jgi:preprotein translocase subunit YajC
MILSSIQFLADTPPAGGDPNQLMNTVFTFGIMAVLFYMLLIRPQQRQRKELEKRIAALQKGDQVVTSSGIYGMVHNIKDRTVVLKIAEATLVEFDKSAVTTILKKDSAVAVESK